VLRKKYCYFERISNYQRVWNLNLSVIVGEYDSMIIVIAGMKLLRRLRASAP
jgi:hypothetical protein